MADPIIEGAIRVLAQMHPGAADDEVLAANSFVFAKSPPGPLAAGDVALAAGVVRSFYNDIAADISKHVQRISFKGYSLEEAPPRTPDISTSDLTTVSSASSLPSEVASCLSYWNGAVPRPTKRGRIFVGPLKQSVVDNTGAVPRITAGHRTLVTDAAVNNLNDAVGIVWGLLSQKLGVIWEIEHVSMDDAFDTQRRRGEDPTTQTVANT